jgi:DNA invertase Pin-like site-specific DNA recombinase
MARIGYARVSSVDQDLENQLAKLKGEGCEVVRAEKVSGGMERRFIKERQREGIKRAKSEGVYQGGKRRLDRAKIKSLAATGTRPAAIAKALGCSRMQVYRVIKESGRVTRERILHRPKQPLRFSLP